MFLSPSSAGRMETCPAQYAFAKEWRTQLEPANLVFGKVAHAAFALVQLAETTDPGATFRRLWEESTRNTAIAYGATADPEKMGNMGAHLLDQAANWWRDSGLELFELNGEPAVEVPLAVRLEQSDVTLQMILDSVVVTPAGRVGPMELKTFASAPSPTWLAGADQLTAEQLGLTVNGVKVDHLGVLVLKKTTAKDYTRAQVLPPELLPARPIAQIREYIGKVEYLADAIRRGIRHRNPGYSYGSPCDMCDFNQLCWFGDTEGLVRKTPYPRDRGTPEASLKNAA